MKPFNKSLKTSQQGAATLLVAIMLLMAMALLTITTSQSGMMEQRIASNDIYAREAQEAAEAGLEYGIAWAAENDITSNLTCTSANETGCPVHSQVTGSTSSESYGNTLNFTKGTDSITVTSVSQGASDSTISARSESYIRQTSNNLFGSSTTMPEPWVIAGCITTPPTGNPHTFLLDPTNKAAVSGSSSGSGCLSPGHLDVHEWSDDNGDNVQDAGEEAAALSATMGFNTGTFPGCPSTNCAWNHAFEMSLTDAKQAATDASHVFAGAIPCGASASPAIYIINNSGPINGADISGACFGTGVDSSTIGEPSQPIVLIIPAASGCPKFNGGVTIYGIVYYESTTACSANGWGGATIYGSVIWEGNVNKPNANSKFIEVDYGSGSGLNNTFQMGIKNATRIPGTWKDF